MKSLFDQTRFIEEYKKSEMSHRYILCGGGTDE